MKWLCGCCSDSDSGICGGDGGDYLRPNRDGSRSDCASGRDRYSDGGEKIVMLVVVTVVVSLVVVMVGSYTDGSGS